MIAAIFRDPEIQARFERDGYVVFDFISAEQAALIAQKFYELHQVIPGGFYSTASIAEDNFKQAISDHAEKVIASDMDRVFRDFKKLGITFLCKAPGQEGKVPVHRDWMVVDESKYFSGTIWVPMADVTEENGALRVLPGSHKLFNDLRSSSLPAVYTGYEEEMWNQMITVPMKAGQAFLLNHAVVHASSANVTDKERLILVCGIIPAEAKLSYYHGTSKGTVEKFDMPDDMFMRHSDIGGRPKIGVKVSEFEYEVKPANRLKIQQLLTSSKLQRTSKPLFKDKELQSSFFKNGYVKIPVLNGAGVQFFSNMPGGAEGRSLPVELTDKVRAAIDAKVTFELPVKIIDARYEVNRNTNSLQPVQQKVAYTNSEDEYCSVTCWVALTDVNANKGTIGFIEGSHLFLNNRRIALKAPYRFKGNELDIYPYLQTIDMKAGEAFIFNNRLFHTQLPTSQTENVMALNLQLTQADWPLSNEDLNAGDDSNYINPEFTTDEVIELIKAEGGEVNKQLTERLMQIDAYKDYVPAKEKINKPASSLPVQTSPDFWHKYTPLNIAREIRKRVLGD